MGAFQGCRAARGAAELLPLLSILIMEFPGCCQLLVTDSQEI